MRTIPLSACPVCRAEDAAPLPDVGLRACRRCGTVFAPEYAHPDDVFTEGYLHGGAGQFGIDLSHPRFHGYLLRCGHRRMEIVEAATGLRGGSLCDVGCGTGELLVAAIDRGWSVQGVEPLEDAAAHASELTGRRVLPTTLEESGLPEESFDVVCAMHVLEHMPSAPDFLETLARWVRPGGYVAVESPNWASVQRVVYGERWSALRPLEHLIHLTPDSLRTAFVNAGLEPAEIRTPSHLDEVHTLDEALESVGRPHWRPRLERLPEPLAMAFLRAVDRRDGRRGKGAAVLGVARKC